MMIKKVKKKSDVLILVFIMAIMLSAYNSYSKYTSNASSVTEASVAEWLVKLEDEDITSKTTLSKNIKFNIIEGNAYVAAGKIAPSSEGYLDLAIDTTLAEVATKYNITFDSTAISSVYGLSLEGYKILTDEEVSVKPTSIPAELEEIKNNEINGDILLNNNKGQKVQLRIFVKWNDDKTEGTNSSQTNTGVNLQKVQIPISVLVEQYN